MGRPHATKTNTSKFSEDSEAARTVGPGLAEITQMESWLFGFTKFCPFLALSLAQFSQSLTVYSVYTCLCSTPDSSLKDSLVLSNVDG